MFCGQDASRGASLNCSQDASIARNMIGRKGRLDLKNCTARLRFGAFEPATTGRYKEDSVRIAADASPTPKGGSETSWRSFRHYPQIAVDPVSRPLRRSQNLDREHTLMLFYNHWEAVCSEADAGTAFSSVGAAVCGGGGLAGVSAG